MKNEHTKNTRIESIETYNNKTITFNKKIVIKIVIEIEIEIIIVKFQIL